MDYVLEDVSGVLTEEDDEGECLHEDGLVVGSLYVDDLAEDVVEGEDKLGHFYISTIGS